MDSVTSKTLQNIIDRSPAIQQRRDPMFFDAELVILAQIGMMSHVTRLPANFTAGKRYCRIQSNSNCRRRLSLVRFRFALHLNTTDFRFHWNPTVFSSAP